jgi:hypothetical protein
VQTENSDSVRTTCGCIFFDFELPSNLINTVTPEMNALTLTKSAGAVLMLRGGPVFSESEVGDLERLQPEK